LDGASIASLVPSEIEEILFNISTQYGSLLDFYLKFKILEKRIIKQRLILDGITIIPIFVKRNPAASFIYLFSDHKGKKLLYAPCDTKPFPLDSEHVYDVDVFITRPGYFESGLRKVNLYMEELMLVPLILLIALVVATVVQVVHFYPHLPDLVISHWGPGGQPDGWLKKASFFWAMFISEVGTTGFIAAIGLALPRIPNRWWNIPHKDYWLASERRSSTVRHVRIQTLWIAVIIGAAMVLLWQDTINANVKPELHWPADFWWTLIITAVIITVWMYIFIRPFKTVPNTEENHKR